MRNFSAFLAALFSVFLLAGTLTAQEGSFEDWQKAAEAGNAQALFNLGLMYFQGEGLPQNEEKGVEMFQAAAAQGNENAREALKQLRAE